MQFRQPPSPVVGTLFEARSPRASSEFYNGYQLPATRVEIDHLDVRLPSFSSPPTCQLTSADLQRRRRLAFLHQHHAPQPRGRHPYPNDPSYQVYPSRRDAHSRLPSPQPSCLYSPTHSQSSPSPPSPGQRGSSRHSFQSGPPPTDLPGSPLPQSQDHESEGGGESNPDSSPVLGFSSAFGSRPWGEIEGRFLTALDDAGDEENLGAEEEVLGCGKSPIEVVAAPAARRPPITITLRLNIDVQKWLDSGTGVVATVDQGDSDLTAAASPAAAPEGDSPSRCGFGRENFHSPSDSLNFSLEDDRRAKPRIPRCYSAPTPIDSQAKPAEQHAVVGGACCDTAWFTGHSQIAHPSRLTSPGDDRIAPGTSAVSFAAVLPPATNGSCSDKVTQQESVAEEFPQALEHHFFSHTHHQPRHHLDDYSDPSSDRQSSSHSPTSARGHFNNRHHLRPEELHFTAGDHLIGDHLVGDHPGEAPHLDYQNSSREDLSEGMGPEEMITSTSCGDTRSGRAVGVWKFSQVSTPSARPAQWAGASGDGASVGPTPKVPPKRRKSRFCTGRVRQCSECAESRKELDDLGSPPHKRSDQWPEASPQAAPEPKEFAATGFAPYLDYDPQSESVFNVLSSTPTQRSNQATDQLGLQEKVRLW